MLTDTSIIDALADAVSQRVVAQLGGRRSTEIFPRLMNVPQAARYLGLTTQAIYHMVHQGKIPFKKIGTRVFLDRWELDAWINNLPSGSE